MKSLKPAIPAAETRQLFVPLRNAFLLVAMLALPELALATPADFADEACTFVNNIVDLLKIASVAVVTIAVIFAGYQIAFAHKRIGDVAPVLIGGLLIGAAGQIAGWILQKDEKDCTVGSTPTTMIEQVLQYLA